MRRFHAVESAAVRLASGDPGGAGALLDASVAVPGSPMVEWHAALVEREVRACLAGRARLEPLSQRELEVLAVLPSRLSLQEVAAQLYVSQNTLKTHLKRVYAKLQVTTRDEAVARAVSLRLVPAGRPPAAAPPAGSSRPT
jgi:DNA-binding CsgD family transcriptional regulator